MPDHITSSDLLADWPTVAVGDGAIAVGRYGWCRNSGTFSADEAWGAWDAYWRTVAQAVA